MTASRATPDLLRVIDAPIPDALSDNVKDFLKQKRGKLLGQAAEPLMSGQITVGSEYSPEDEAKIRKMQAHFDSFKVADKGIVAMLVGEYVESQHHKFKETAHGAVLLHGISYWYECGTTIGQLHHNGQSAGLARKKVELAYAQLGEITDYALERIEQTVVQVVNDQLAQELERLDQIMQATLAAEREQMTAAADAAQRDATDARRERDELEKKVRALEQQLKKVEYDQQKAMRGHQQDLAELPRLRAENEQLAGQLRWLSADNAALKQKAATTAEQLQAVERQLLDVQTRPTPPTPEVPMPKTALLPSRKAIPAPLADLSFVAFLKSRGHPASFEGGSVRHQLKEAEYEQLDAEWRAAIPDEAAALAQLRAVVQPLLAEVA